MTDPAQDAGSPRDPRCFVRLVLHRLDRTSLVGGVSFVVESRPFELPRAVEYGGTRYVLDLRFNIAFVGVFASYREDGSGGADAYALEPGLLEEADPNPERTADGG